MSDQPGTCDVFISHSMEDDVQVNKISAVLQSAGLEVWLDHERSAHYLQHALMVSKIGLIVLSKVALANDEIKREWAYYYSQYLRHAKQMLVVLLEPLASDEIPYLFNGVPVVRLMEDVEGQLELLIAAIQGTARLEVLASEDYLPDAPPNLLAQAVLYTAPDQILELPDQLIGREDDLIAVSQQLNQGKRVMIQATDGTGKTALAASIAASWLPMHPAGKVLWIRAGAASTAEIFNAIGRCLQQAETLFKLPEEEQPAFISGLFQTSGVGLVILDSCWNDVALRRILQLIPETVSVLMTSQQRYAVAGVTYCLRDLSTLHALKLLNSRARLDLKEGAAALELCKALGNQAMAVELASKMLAAGWNVGQLQQKLNSKLSELVPVAQSPDTALQALIEICLWELDEISKVAFFGFAVFEALELNPHQLTLLWVGEPEVSPELIAKARREIPEFAKLNVKQEAIIQGIRRMMLSKIDLTDAENSLKTLARVGLIDFIPSSNPSPMLYTMHERIYAVASDIAQDLDLTREYERSVYATLRYVQHYEQPTPDNFKILHPSIDVVIRALQWCFDHERWMETERFIGSLKPGNGLLEYFGYYGQSLELLEQAVLLTKQCGNSFEVSKHVYELGKLHRHLGNYPEAITHFDRLLSMICADHDVDREGLVLTELGNSFARMGQYRYAIDYYEKGLAVARATRNKASESFTLGVMGNAFTHLREYNRAITCHEQALAISRMLGIRLDEASDLGNLGNVYRLQQRYDQSIDYYEQALTLTRASGNRQIEGSWLGNLGAVYSELGDYVRAFTYHEQALMIFRAIKDKRGETIELANLGNTCARMGESGRSIDYFKQGLVLAKVMGSKENEGRLLGSLGGSYYQMHDYGQALNYYEQAVAVFARMDIQPLINEMRQNIAQVKARLT